MFISFTQHQKQYRETFLYCSLSQQGKNLSIAEHEFFDQSGQCRNQKYEGHLLRIYSEFISVNEDVF